MYCDEHASLLSVFCDAVRIYSGKVVRLKENITYGEHDPECLSQLFKDAQDARESCKTAQGDLQEHDRQHHCTLLPSF